MSQKLSALPSTSHAAPILLLGGGKLARHLAHYFTLKSIPHLTWLNARSMTADFDQLLKQASAIWILVSDRAISEVHSKLIQNRSCPPCFHASAALSIPSVFTIHPLQTFGPELYPLETYQTMTLTLIDEEWTDAPAVAQHLISFMGNPVQKILEKDRTLYHAACVMIANFPQILWSQVFSAVEKKPGFESSAFKPLLTQAVHNFLELGSKALTGPLVRGDQATLEKHQEALKTSPLGPLYESFVELYGRTQKGNITQ